MAALAVGAAPAGAVSWNKEVKSVPGLRIPRVWTTVNDDARSPGYIFVTPRAKLGQRTGPTILDADGKVIWFHRLSPRRTAAGLQPQVYRGKPALVWGERRPLVHEGDNYRGDARSVYNVIADARYHIIARIRARGRGVRTDLHEFRITRRNTALVLGWRVVKRNLSGYGGPARSAILDNVVQEIDIRTGKLLFNWSAAHRISPRYSYVRPPKRSGAWDAYHFNSISEDSDGSLLLTSRHMSAVYKIARRSGRVLWKLGGRHGNFRLGRGARFRYPHDAQRAPDGSITIFDNNAGPAGGGGVSRALRLRVDARRRTAHLLEAFRHPAGASSTSQGNAAELADGNVFVGWGISPWFSEYTADGRLVFAAHFKDAWSQSYRAFKGDWHATPKSRPALMARPGAAGTVVAFASWNGATEVRSWRLLGGSAANSLTEIGTAPWADFETELVFPGTPPYVKVQALDAAGNLLGESAVTKSGS